MKNTALKIYLSLRSAVLYPFGLFAGKVSADYGNIKKVLLVRIDRIGDMVMTLPAIRAVRARFPAAEIQVLASPAAACLLAAEPAVNGVMIWDARRGPAGAAEVIMRVRKARFDLAVDLCSDPELKTALITFLSGAARRLGYQISGRGVFFNIRRYPPAERVHAARESEELLKALGIELAERPPEITVSAEAAAEAGRFLAAAGLSPDDALAAFHPGGHYPSQRWALEGFVRTAARLYEEYGFKILLIGSVDERSLLDAFVAGLSGKTDVVKAVSIRPDVLCALLRSCRIFIGNNSGPLHLAAAVGVPTVSTMGPTDPVRWQPLGRRQIVLRTALPCAGCGKGGCRGGCMTDITAGQVIAAAEELLKNAD